LENLLGCYNVVRNEEGELGVIFPAYLETDAGERRVIVAVKLFEFKVIDSDNPAYPGLARALQDRCVGKRPIVVRA